MIKKWHLYTASLFMLSLVLYNIGTNYVSIHDGNYRRVLSSYGTSSSFGKNFLSSDDRTLSYHDRSLSSSGGSLSNGDRVLPTATKTLSRGDKGLYSDDSTFTSGNDKALSGGDRALSSVHVNRALSSDAKSLASDDSAFTRESKPLSGDAREFSSDDGALSSGSRPLVSSKPIPGAQSGGNGELSTTAISLSSDSITLSIGNKVVSGDNREIARDSSLSSGDALSTDEKSLNSGNKSSSGGDSVLSSSDTPLSEDDRAFSRGDTVLLSNDSALSRHNITLPSDNSLLSSVNRSLSKNSDGHSPSSSGNIDSSSGPPSSAAPPCKSFVLNETGFTLVILTHERTDGLLAALKHWNNVENIVKVLIVWNNPGVQIPDAGTIRKVSPHLDITFLPQSKNSLNNRFMVYSNISTEAVLMIDDDWVIGDDAVQVALQAWRAMPCCIVGFHARTVSKSYKTYQYGYYSDDGYQMVLNVGFIHRGFFRIYENAPSELLDLVDEYINCEDILMNFLIANSTGTHSGVLIKAPHEPHHVSRSYRNGLSIQGNHVMERIQCIKYFVKYFGSLSLKSNSFFVVPYTDLGTENVV